MENNEEYLNSEAKDLLAQMTVEEKVKLLYGNRAWHTYGVPRLNAKPIVMHDGPLGVRAVDDARITLLDGAPKATCFPAPCLTACSFDPNVTQSIGIAEGKEARVLETNMILAPGVNIKRNPLCGRNFEYLSEDPYLAGKMASGFIRGIQSTNVGVCLKHFALNSQETYRDNYNAEVDERAMRDVYLKPFEIAVKESNPYSVMSSYNRINGVYSSDNSYLLNSILRSEWGFKGIVVSDWGGTNDPIRSHNCGLDLEMPCYENRVKQLKKALKNGSLNKDKLDECCLRLIRTHLILNDNPEEPLKYDFEKSHEISKNAALNSIVLLKNDDETLPISNYDNTCIIGALADKARYQGAGSSQVTTNHLVSYLMAANENKDKDHGVKYVPGYPLHRNSPDILGLQNDAVALASNSNKVILVLGLPQAYESEGFDRKTMELPKEQIALFNAIYKVNHNIVVVLLLGAPVELPFAKDARAILLAYLPGEAGGEAINEIILGKTNPSGKIAETWPIKYKDCVSSSYYPGDEHTALYKESVFVGYRYYLSADVDVLYPFGYGLSYTNFEYSDLEISKDVFNKDGVISLSFTIKNTGNRDGQEVAEVYSSTKSARVFRPLRELRSFTKVFLKAKESKKVTLVIPVSSLGYFDATSHSSVVEAGTYKIEVGSSSCDIKLTSTFKINSNDEIHDLHNVCPSYFKLKEFKGLKPANYEFINLLGHEITVDEKKKFDFNSTLGDIEHTFIGKIIMKVSSNPKGYMNKDKDAIADQIQEVRETPIRKLCLAGINEHIAIAILRMANGHYLGIITTMLFARRK